MPPKPVRILFACGGTAGHINPALSVAGAIKEKYKNAVLLFAGNPDGMEAELVQKAGYDFAPIRIHGFQRRISLENLRRNLLAVKLLATASARAKRIIREFEPDLVMGTGGYVSGPVVRQAAKMGIKTATHEQNAFPGVTTKLLCKYVDKVLLTNEKAREYLPAGRDYVVTGLPVRQEIVLADRQKARSELGVGDRICVLSFGGSNGARGVNEALAELIAGSYGKGRLHHIHATGRFGTEEFPALLEKKGVDHRGDPHIDIREYIHDMAQCLAAADLVICRAGASTISELQASGKASILIPSPNVAENHQYHNAMVLADRNAALVVEEKDLTGERLCKMVEQLTAEPQELANLSRNAAATAIIDAHLRIVEELEELLGLR